MNNIKKQTNPKTTSQTMLLPKEIGGFIIAWEKALFPSLQL